MSTYTPADLRTSNHIAPASAPRLRVVDIFNTDRAAKSLGMRRAELLNQDGRFENVIVCGDGPQVATLRSRGIEVLTTPIPRRLAPFAMWRCVRRLTALLEQAQVTIVHTHGSTASLCGRLAARRAKVPLIVHTIHGFHFHHGMGPLRHRFYVAGERALTRCTDVLLFQNEEDLQESFTHKIVAHEGNFWVGNGIDLRRFVPADECAPAHPPVILMIGRFERVKNQAMLLRAAKILTQRGVNFQLWFAGAGPALEPNRTLAGELGLAERTRFFGYVNDVLPLIQQASVAVLTSVKEGIPRGLVEPMAAGLPVVATDVKGNRETVAPEHKGWLVPLDDAEALAEKLRQLLADEGLRRRLGQAAAHWVRRRFDEDAVVQRLIDNFERLLAARGLTDVRSRIISTANAVNEPDQCSHES